MSTLEPPARSRHRYASVAVVTGGARGLGHACALRLAERGYDLAIVDLIDPIDAADAVRATGRRAVGDPVRRRCRTTWHEQSRLSKRSSVAAMCWSTTPAYFRGRHSTTSTSSSGVESSTSTSPRHSCLAKQSLPGMTERGFGRIINLSSNTVGLPVEGMTHYITSKAAVIGFTRALASEVGQHGITVNSVAPGLTPTEGLLANQANSSRW